MIDYFPSPSKIWVTDELNVLHPRFFKSTYFVRYMLHFISNIDTLGYVIHLDFKTQKSNAILQRMKKTLGTAKYNGAYLNVSSAL